MISVYYSREINTEIIMLHNLLRDTRDDNMPGNRLTPFQNSGDFLQSMINSRTANDPSKGEKNKGSTHKCVHTKGLDASFPFPPVHTSGLTCRSY